MPGAVAKIIEDLRDRGGLKGTDVANIASVSTMSPAIAAMLPSEALRDEDGTILRWYVVNFDIDDQVRAQESLRLADERLARALRVASLSELSVSIAHELNQPLQAVVANAGAFQRWLNADPPNFDHARRVAQKIIRNADAAAQVVSRIRALFNKTCAQCHNGSLDQSLSRAKFDVTKLDSMPLAEKQTAIARMRMPASDRKHMPPAMFRSIPDDQLQLAIAELTK